jgi:GNAT superfamily N-acetyltransferase
MIRPAILADAPAIARVHVDSWRETYSDIIPEEVLANFGFEFRLSRWNQILCNPKTEEATFVVLHEGKILGFASCGPERDQDPCYSSELYAIYLLKSCQGKGLGKEMFKVALDFLRSRGHTSMLLWALRGNETIGFYERMGGVVVYEKDIRVSPLMLPGVAYGWPNIGGLKL